MLLRQYTKLTSDLSTFLEKYNMDISENSKDYIILTLNNYYEIQIVMTWTCIVCVVLFLLSQVYLHFAKPPETELDRVGMSGINAVGYVTLFCGGLLAMPTITSSELDFTLGLSPKLEDKFISLYTPIEDFYNKHKSEITTSKVIEYDSIDIEELPLVHFKLNGKMHSINIDHQEISNTEEIVLSETELNPNYKLLDDLDLYQRERTIFIPRD